MKFVVLVCFLAYIGLSTAGQNLHPRGCIYALGKCIRECEEGTRAYTTGCGKLTPEATCAEPNPRPGKSIICDYSACYCEPPTVRDQTSGNCVKIEDCKKE